jgi:hypothetical protein
MIGKCMSYEEEDACHMRRRMHVMARQARDREVQGHDRTRTTPYTAGCLRAMKRHS